MSAITKLLSVLFLFAFTLAVFLWGGVGPILTLALALLLLPTAAYFVWCPPRLPRQIWLALSAVLIWLVLCFLRSHNGGSGWRVLVLQGAYLLSFLAGAKSSSGDKSGRIFLHGLCAVGLAAILLGYYRFCSGFETFLLLEQPPEYQGRMNGPFVSPNHFAALASATALLLFGFLCDARSAIAKVIFGTGCLLSAGAVFLSGSRIVLVICFVALVFLMRRTVFTQARRTGIILFFFLVLGASAWLGIGGGHRLLHVLDDPGVAGRMTVWADTVAMIEKAPVVGYGLGNFVWRYPQFRSVGITRRVDFSHSDLLQTWAEQGLIGILLWGLFFWATWRIRRGATDSLGAAVRASLGVMLAISLVDFPFQLPANGMLAFALLGFMAGNQRNSATGAPATTPRVTLLRLAASALLVFLAWLLVRDLTGQVYCLTADKSRRQLDWDSARTKYQKALAWCPTDAALWNRLGELCANTYLLRWKSEPQLAQEAELAFQQSLALRPADGTTWLSLGLLFMDEGKTQDARTCLDKALALDPQNAFFHDMMARFLLSEGRRDEAELHLRMALWLYPRDAVAQALLEKVRRKAWEKTKR